MNEQEMLQNKGGMWFLWVGAIVAVLGIISAWDDITRGGGDE